MTEAMRKVANLVVEFVVVQPAVECWNMVVMFTMLHVQTCG